MPKVSKINSGGSKNSKPKQAERHQEERKDFYCDRCGKHYIRQKNNFPASQSTLFRGNGGYLSTCNRCVDELFDHYKAVLEDEKEAMRRMCLKYDIYWNPDIYGMLRASATSTSRIRTYISKTNLYQHVGKTFDDTLDEESNFEVIASIEEVEEANAKQKKRSKQQIEISPDIVRYWGTGFTPEMYMELENRRDYWLSQYPEGTVLEPGEEALLRQICNMEISINNDRVAGKPIEKSVNALNNLLGSMNIKPSQKREIEDSYVPFGVEIKRFEEEDPIPEPDSEFDDVDGMRKNVISWFLGSLCKTAGIKNEYSQYFEDEIAKYTVERPEYEDDEYMDDISGDNDG